MRPQRRTLSLRLLLAGAMIVATLGVLLTPVASAAPLTTINESCPSQTQFQHDLNVAASESPAQIVETVPFCTILLRSGLTIGPSADITVLGNFLSLNAEYGGFDVITIDDTNGPGRLHLERTFVEEGLNGINLKGDGTIDLDESAVVGNNEYGIVAGYDSTSGKFTSTDVVVAKDRSTIGGNSLTGIAASNVTLDGSTVTENYELGIEADIASVSRSVIDGNRFWGIFANDSAEVVSSTVRDNGSGTAASGKYNAIGAGKSVTVTDSVVNGNDGSGIQTPGDAKVTDSEIDSNGGSGVDSSNATVTSSTISGNAEFGITVERNVAIANSTISDNLGDAYFPGDGIHTFGNGDRNTAIIDFSTISGNHGQAISGFDDATLTADILAGTQAGTGTLCTIGNVTDNGYNLTTSGTCELDSSTSQIVSPAQLDLEPLEPNGPAIGAPTATVRWAIIELNPDSVALDKVPNAGPGLCLDANGNVIVDPNGNTIHTDETGIARPQVSGCDVGAFESPQFTYTKLPIVFPGQIRTLIQEIVHLIGLSKLRVGSSGQLMTTELIGPGHQVVSFAHMFTLNAGRLSGHDAQQLGLDLGSLKLAPGTWKLLLKADNSGAGTLSLSFRVQ